MKNSKESKIQQAGRIRLESHGWLVNKIITCSKPGWPDQEAYKDGKTIFIEYKKPGETPDPLQEVRAMTLRMMGFKVFVIDKIEDLHRLP